MIKSTAIDPTAGGFDGVYRKVGPARVFTSESAAIAAIKSNGPEKVRPGDVIVLICRGPMGSGMEETYQITCAETSSLRQGDRVGNRCALFGSVDMVLALATSVRRPWRGADRQTDRWRSDRDHRRSCPTSRDDKSRRSRNRKQGCPMGDDRAARGEACGADLAPDERLPADTRLWARCKRQVAGPGVGVSSTSTPS